MYGAVLTSKGSRFTVTYICQIFSNTRKFKSRVKLHEEYNLIDMGH